MKVYYGRTNGPVDTAIDQLIDMVGDISNRPLVRELILTALKAGQEEKEDKADLKLMNSTMKELRYTSLIFAPYRDIRKITIFGSARTDRESPLYSLAREVGERIAAEGFMVITGGGPGIMQAVNEGAGPEHSFGVNIRLPFEQKANPVMYGNRRLIVYKYFFNRKVAFIKEAHAIILFPGGFGTLDEAMEALTLLQTGKRAPIPVVFIEEPGGNYWPRLIRFFRNNLSKRGYIDDTDFSLFDYVHSAEEAMARIRRFYHRYHSMRYVDGKLVIRLSVPVTEGQVTELRKGFLDILVPPGEFSLSGPLEAEKDEPGLANLPRIVADFNRKSYGRLRSLIRAINEV
jgi:uncharacterized protein (TIGR00730 family)